MFLRFGCLFVLVPLIELALLIWMGRVVGLLPTLALVFSTGLLGAALAHREGMRAFTAVQQELAAGRIPGRPLLAGLGVLLGGALLLTPGVLTDVAGLLLLFPPSRNLFFSWTRRRLEAALASGTVRIATWGLGAWGDRAESSGPAAGRPEGPNDHGPGRGFPFEFRKSSGGDEEPEKERPPRPGEIIQD